VRRGSSAPSVQPYGEGLHKAKDKNVPRAEQQGQKGVWMQGCLFLKAKANASVGLLSTRADLDES